MPTIIINATAEQIKAVDGVVVDHEVWLQEAWDNKAASCTERVIKEETDLNPNKMTVQEKSDKIKNTTFKTRKQKDIDSGVQG